MTALFACVPLLHVGLGIAMVAGGFDGKDAPPPIIGWLFIVIAGIFILSGWALSACIILAGRKIKRCRSWTFCLVVACFMCLMMPFGTFLGVFTVIVLMRESVRA